MLGLEAFVLSVNNNLESKTSFRNGGHSVNIDLEGELAFLPRCVFNELSSAGEC